MLEYSHITRHDNIPFAEYQTWQEYSHSFLKYQKRGILEPKEITDNIMFGAIVDAILCNEVTPEMYANYMYTMALKHCATIIRKFDAVLKHSAKQVCYKGRITYNGFILPVKVRLDMQFRNNFLFENKITFSGCKNKRAPDEVKIKSILDLIVYMGYDNQVFHQLKMSKVYKGYIMIHSVPLDETFLFERNNFDTAQNWWIEQIKYFGL